MAADTIYVFPGYKIDIRAFVHPVQMGFRNIIMALQAKPFNIHLEQLGLLSRMWKMADNAVLCRRMFIGLCEHLFAMAVITQIRDLFIKKILTGSCVR